MIHFPGIEATILRTIAEEGEARPPRSPRLAQEYWWMAAAQLQARRLVKADQQAGVVRPPAPKKLVLSRETVALLDSSDRDGRCTKHTRSRYAC